MLVSTGSAAGGLIDWNQWRMASCPGSRSRWSAGTLTRRIGFNRPSAAGSAADRPAAAGELVHQVVVNHQHGSGVLGRADGLGPGGIGGGISIESSSDLVSIAAQICAVEVESAAGLGPGGIGGGRLAAARTAAGGLAWMPALRSRSAATAAQASGYDARESTRAGMDALPLGRGERGSEIGGAGLDSAW
jgi:hypothetical protein